MSACMSDQRSAQKGSRPAGLPPEVWQHCTLQIADVNDGAHTRNVDRLTTRAARRCKDATRVYSIVPVIQRQNCLASAV